MTAPTSRRRLLLVNSNTDAAMTEWLAGKAMVADQGAELTIATAPFGASYVDSRADVVVAAHAILVAIAQASTETRFDACVIACFGEPGLGAARELFDFPVVGLAEAAMHSAAQLAPRFAICSRSTRWISMLEELVTLYGFRDRCAGIYALSALAPEAQTQAESTAALVRVMPDLLRESGAAALILGGAALTGIAAEVEAGIGLPVIDALTAGFAQAGVLAALRPGKAWSGPYSWPGHRDVTGLDAALAKRFQVPPGS
jgi:allantoin racemase